ncbi:SDR family NAD(P)-dependent oxidoreductase [Gulosibacter sp. 10]|uniref:SDR family NAD(P)-dependent oxidoreductase n=1 Tax=Gulosibacter sp. 10 TaxID=1255570 RepID=UPI00097EA8ED|nr:glucose 1-dehydrogenase [Gulosibacter sp. 10]SJM63919.1 Dehydrogenases with different specificities (related to short-chain alcohol dehydrogenases) [Gulosibacter sp. 10]
MTARLEGKTIGITGAASGMGLAFAHRFAEEGANVLIVDLDPQAAEAAAKSIIAAGGRAAWAQANVTERDQVRAAIQVAVSEFGRIDVWFNNAGLNRPLGFLDVTEENWSAILDVNALGTLIGTQEAAKQFRQQDGLGKVVNTASISGRVGDANTAAYCAAKSAVISLTQSGAKALAEDDITVNAFAPGVVATPLWEKLDEDLMAIGASRVPGEAMKNFSAGILRGRVAEAEDIVGTALFLASQDSDYMTGQVIMIDGGMVLV